MRRRKETLNGLVVKKPDELTRIREELKFPQELARSTLNVGIQDQQIEQVTAVQLVKRLNNNVAKSKEDLGEFKKGAPYLALGLGIIVLSAFSTSIAQGLLFLLLVATGPGLLFGLKGLQHYLNKRDRNQIGRIEEEMETRSERVDGMTEALKELPEAKKEE